MPQVSALESEPLLVPKVDIYEVHVYPFSRRYSIFTNENLFRFLLLPDRVCHVRIGDLGTLACALA